MSNNNFKNELNKNKLNAILKGTKAQRPFMLFPLRLETHFRNVKNQKQLCVRVIPDEIMLDYHTEKLTKEEIEDGKFFWIQWYIASGSDVREYEAWEVLCRKYPVYRAAWICRCLKPEYIDDYRPGHKLFYRRPYSNLASIEENCKTIYDHLSIITQHLSEDDYRTTSNDDEYDDSVPAEEKTPATDEYLVEYYIRTKLFDVQRMLFEIKTGISSCKYVVDYLYDNINNTIAYLSRNLDDYIKFYERHFNRIGENCRRLELWDVDYTVLLSLRKDVDNFINTMAKNRITLDDMIKSYLADKSLFSFNNINETTKLDIPGSNILPQKFFFIGEVANGNKDKIYAYSNDIPSDLQMGIDPNEMEVDENGQKVSPFQIDSKGNMVIKGGAKWMTDYDEAEKCGMAITVPISNDVTKFNYIYVLGINDFSEKQNYEMLTELFNGHNYTASGISYVAAGTPTNSLDGKFKDESEQIKRERFDIEVNDKYKTSDDQAEESSILANFTGMDYESCWRRVAGGNQKQNSKAKRVYQELWDHFKGNIESDDDYLNNMLDTVGDFVINNVRARGILPTIKVDTLPYGFLPAVDYKKFLETFDKDSVEAKLLRQFIALAEVWKEIRKKDIPHSQNLVGDSAEKNYMKMAGQTPYSASYEERSVVRCPLLEKNYLKETFADYISDLNDLGFFADQPIDFTKEASLECLKNCLSEDLKKDIENEDLNIYVAEFLDLFTYRLDAWFMGVTKSAQDRLKKVGHRNAPQIGAYGWVFDLKENDREKIDDIVKCRDIVDKMKLNLDPKTTTFYKNTGDDKNHYVVAPSLQHALTTAVLRSAYLKSKNGAEDAHICVNLSSMRVRQALRLVDGVRRGMSTSVILGVDLERYLHDAHDMFEEYLDEFIYPLRQRFKQVVDLNSQTEEAGNYSMQVINGEALLNTFIEEWNWSKSVSSWLEENCQDTEYACLEWLRTLNENSNYSLFAKQKKETEENITAKGHVFFKQIERLMDSYDALNDLLLSEGVHRLVMGDKSSFYAISQFLKDGKGSIPDPEILKIPSEHVVVSHKAGVMLPEVDETPQKAFDIADPAINAWIESVIGGMDKLKFFVKEKNSSETITTRVYSLKDLDISGSEYLYLSSYEGTFKNYLETKWLLKYPRAFGYVEILEEDEDGGWIPEDGELSLAEDKVRLNTLRSIVLHSREMRASDLQSALWEGADESEFTNMDELKRYRYEPLVVYLGNLHTNIDNWIRKSAKKEIYSDGFVREAYEYLCECVETGLVNCLGKFDFDIFTGNVDSNLWPDRIQKAQSLQQDLLNTMEDVEQQLVKKIATAKSLVESKDILTIKDLTSAIQALTLDSLKVIPRFNLLKGNPSEKDLVDRAGRIDAVVKNGPCFYKNLNYNSFDQWEDEVSEVRDGMKNLHQLSMFQTAFDLSLGKVAVLQTESSKSEVVAGNWLGLTVKDESELQDVDSMVLYNTDAYNLQYKSGKLSLSTNAGLVIDAWLEYIPYKKHDAGMVFHIDRPDNEAPQAILVAINHNIVNVNTSDSEQNLEEIPSGRLCWCPACRKESLRYRDCILDKGNNSCPAQTNNAVACDEKWDIDTLLGILDETRFLMMNRAVDPDVIYNHPSLSPIFPLLSEIHFKIDADRYPSSFSTSAFYKAGFRPFSVFDVISGGKNIKE
ncbi:hypothetical protein [Fibrobacter sp.]|uniref:hypothetical protein n=1 Tax=Fibrobacter sp. TaxID=35828 RepID=UPI00388F8F45